jgi:hypothetical protein
MARNTHVPQVWLEGLTAEGSAKGSLIEPKWLQIA